MALRGQQTGRDITIAAIVAGAAQNDDLATTGRPGPAEQLHGAVRNGAAGTFHEQHGWRAGCDCRPIGSAHLTRCEKRQSVQVRLWCHAHCPAVPLSTGRLPAGAVSGMHHFHKPIQDATDDQGSGPIDLIHSTAGHSGPEPRGAGEAERRIGLRDLGILPINYANDEYLGEQANDVLPKIWRPGA